jgi:hypothetical protein
MQKSAVAWLVAGGSNVSCCKPHFEMKSFSEFNLKWWDVCQPAGKLQPSVLNQLMLEG